MKADFTRRLAKELIENDIWATEKKNEKMKGKAEGTMQNSWKRIEVHELVKILPFCGKWNGNKFACVKDKCQK